MSNPFTNRDCGNRLTTTGASVIRYLAVALCLMGLATALPVSAAESQAIPAEPDAIILRAKTAVFRQQEGTGVYEGNAEMQQGTRSLQADRISIFTENNQLQRVEATGNPVKMTEEGVLEARAGKVVYDVLNEKIILLDGAHINHQGRTFEGNRIEYNTQTREVYATGEGSGRVILTIPPTPADEETEAP